MNKQRPTIAMLVLWLAIFLNFERISGPIGIASFVHLLVPLLIAGLLLAPEAFVRANLAYLAVPTLIVYIVMKFCFHSPTFNESLPTTITEVVSLILTLLLARKTAAGTWDLEAIISQLTFEPTGLSPRIYDTIYSEALYREVRRSRNFDHDLAVLAVRPEIDKEMELPRVLREVQKSMVARFIKARIAKILSEELRDTDLIAQDGEGFLIVLPETSGDEAHLLSGRLKAQVYQALELRLNAGVAAFPTTNITFTGLVETARDHMVTSKPKREVDGRILTNWATIHRKGIDQQLSTQERASGDHGKSTSHR